MNPAWIILFYIVYLGTVFGLEAVKELICAREDDKERQLKNQRQNVKTQQEGGNTTHTGEGRQTDQV